MKRTLTRTGILWFAFALSQHAWAVNATWNGGDLGTTNGWSDAGNWGGTAPISGADSLTFAGTTGLTNLNDFVGATFNAITFDGTAGAFLLQGNDLTLAGDVINNSISLQTINLNLATTAVRTFNTASGNITVNGLITGSGGGLTKVSAGTLTLNGNNSYDGGATISNGTVVVGHNNALGTASVTLAGGTLINSGDRSLSNNIIVSVNSTSTIDVASGGNITVNGNISGGGTIVRGTSAAQSLFLNGDNSGFNGTYTTIFNGNAIVRFGSPNAGSAAASWYLNCSTASRQSLNFDNGTIHFGNFNGAGQINNNGGSAGQTNTIIIGEANGTANYQGAIVDNTAESIAIIKGGSGAQTFSGANTYSGGTLLTNGTLVIGHDNAFGSGPVTLMGGTLDDTGSYTVTNSVTVAANTTNTITTTSGNITLSGSVSGSGVIVRGTSGIPSTLYVGGNWAGFSGMYTSPASGSAVIRFQSANAGSAAARWFLNANATGRRTLEFDNGTIHFGSFNGGSGSDFRNNGGSPTTNNTIVVGELNGANDVFSGTVVDGGRTISVLKAGTGTQTFSGANSYSGGTTITGGWFVVGNNTGLGTGPVTMSGGTIQNSGTDITMGTNLVVAANTTNFLVPNGKNMTINGGLSGGGVLTRLSLGAPNSVYIGGDSGGFSGIYSNVGGVTRFNTVTAGSSNALWIANANFTFDDVNGGSMYFGALAGNATIGGNVQTGVVFNVVVGGLNTDSTFAGVIANNNGWPNASGSLTKVGTGKLTLSGINTYTNGTIVSSGTLALNNGGSAGAIRGALSINSGAIVSLSANDALGYTAGTCVPTVNINGGTLDNAVAGNNGYITSYNLTGGNMTSSGGGAYNLSSQSITTLASSVSSVVNAPLLIRDNSTLKVFVNSGTVPSGIDLLVSGIVTQSPATTGALLKDGAGKLVLAGSNTYTGTTTISNGTVLVNGSIAGGVTVTSAGALGGTGFINGPVTVAGALAPGASIGTLTVSNSLLLNSSAALNYELAAPGTGDRVNVTGALTLDGTLNVTNVGSFAAGNYTLLTYGSLVDLGLNVTALPGGFSGSISNDTVGKAILLVVTSGGGPAPGSYAAWAAYYGLTNGCAVCGPNDDFDGDGMSNTNEFLAGFNPTNGTAYAHITSETKSGNDIVITYLGSNGDTNYPGGPSIRTNVLEAATTSNYTNNFPITVQTDILSDGIGSGASVTVTDTNAATSGPARYYRVRIIAP